MKTTIRYCMFETNSSSEHTFILISKETFEAWKLGKIRIDRNKGDSIECVKNGEFIESMREELHGCEDGWVYEDADFKKGGWHGFISKRMSGTYENMMRYFESSHGSWVLKSEAKKEYVDPEDWEETCDGDVVEQRSCVEIEDDGKNVKIHAWGR